MPTQPNQEFCYLPWTFDSMPPEAIRDALQLTAGNAEDDALFAAVISAAGQQKAALLSYDDGGEFLRMLPQTVLTVDGPTGGKTFVLIVNENLASEYPAADYISHHDASAAPQVFDPEAIRRALNGGCVATMAQYVAALNTNQ